jgi:hypothetical protein
MEIDLRGIKNVAIAFYSEVENPSWETIVHPGDLTKPFLAPFITDGQFSVVNLHEFADKLSRSINNRIISQNALSEIATVTGADACVFGEVLTVEYTENIITADVRRFHKPDGQQLVRKGRLYLQVHIRVVNTRLQSMIWDQVLNQWASAETVAADEEPAPIDSSRLAMQAAEEMAQTVLELTRQIQESVLVTFLNDSAYPEVERAVKKAREGNWTAAQQSFQQIANEAAGTEAEHKMLYNLGIAYQYGFNFRKAKESFEQAYALKDSKRYLIAIDDCLKMEQSYLEVVKQESK